MEGHTDVGLSCACVPQEEWKSKEVVVEEEEEMVAVSRRRRRALCEARNRLRCTHCFRGEGTGAHRDGCEGGLV